MSECIVHVCSYVHEPGPTDVISFGSTWNCQHRCVLVTFGNGAMSFESPHFMASMNAAAVHVPILTIFSWTTVRWLPGIVIASSGTADTLNVPQLTMQFSGSLCTFRTTAEKTMPGAGTAQSVERRQHAKIARVVVDIILSYRE